MLPSEKEWIQDLLKQRYYTENEESWLDICERVSTLGRTKVDKKKIYGYLSRCDFLPNSPTLFNAGTGNGNLSACYVLPMEDDLDKIILAIQNDKFKKDHSGFFFGNSTENGYYEEKELAISIFQRAKTFLQEGAKMLEDSNLFMNPRHVTYRASW